MKKLLVLCTTDSMIWNFLIPHIKEIQFKGIEVECACSQTGFYFKEVEKMTGCITHEIPFARNPCSTSNIRAISMLNKLVKKNCYDAIFCHEPVGGALGRIVGHKNGCEVIYMAHGFHFYKGAPLSSKIYYVVEKFLSKYTDVLLTINQEDYESSTKFKARKTQKVNGIGVNIDKFKKCCSDYLCKQYDLHENDFLLLSVGELISRKNHKVILQSLKMINDPHIHYFIAGEGELEKTLKNIIYNYGLQNQVHLLGFCRNVSELYNSCDAFIFPSKQEGLSMALMEAMACGKPVIASNIRGNVDLIDNEQGGVLVKTNDLYGYINAIKKLKADTMLRVSMGEYNEHKIMDFDIETVKKQLEKYWIK